MTGATGQGCQGSKHPLQRALASQTVGSGGKLCFWVHWWRPTRRCRLTCWCRRRARFPSILVHFGRLTTGSATTPEVRLLETGKTLQQRPGEEVRSQVPSSHMMLRERHMLAVKPHTNGSQDTSHNLHLDLDPSIAPESRHSHYHGSLTAWLVISRLMRLILYVPELLVYFRILRHSKTSLNDARDP